MSIAMTTARTAPHAHAIAAKSLRWTLPAATPAGDEDLQALQRMGVKLRFARNEMIFNEGDEADYSYKVVSGAIRLCKHMADGRRQIADFVLPGDFCGFLHLNEHRYTAEATSDTVVMCYQQRQIEQMGEQMPSMRKRLLGFLAQRLSGMQDHLMMLGRQTAKERVISFLLMMAEHAGSDEGDAIVLPMSRQDIADYLGLTIETVCRVLSDLKRARLIALPDLHRVVLLDIDNLHALADGEE